MSYCVRIPVDSIQDCKDTLSMHPFLGGDTRKEIEQMRKWNPALFPAKSTTSMTVHEKNGDFGAVFRKPGLLHPKKYTKRYATLRYPVPKLPHCTASSEDPSSFIFTNNLERFLRSGGYDSEFSAPVERPESSRGRASPSLPSCSMKSVRLNVPRRTESLNGNTGHAVSSCRSSRRSKDNDKSAVSTERCKEFTGTKSASAKLGALSIKDSLTLIKTSRRRYKRADVTANDRKDEKNSPAANILDTKKNTNERGRTAGKRELQSAKAAEKNSRLVRAKLKSLRKTLHQALQATQKQL